MTVTVRTRALLGVTCPLLLILSACGGGDTPPAPASSEAALTDASQRSADLAPGVADAAAPTKVEGRALSSAEGQEIAWSRSGAGEVTLVFVHGWQCDGSYWREQIDTFADDYRVVTLDLAGHGASTASRQDWSMDAFGADVAAVAEAAAGEGPVVLIGHSMGGPVILQAARRIDRTVGLIAVDTLRGAGNPPPEPEIQAQLAPVRADYNEVAANLVDGMFVETTPMDLRQEIRTAMLAGDPDIGIAMMAGLRRMNYPAAFSALDVPMVVINSNYRPTAVDPLQTLYPRMRFVEIQGTGHFPMLEAPEQFNALLSQALEQLLREADMP
ncbi:MAG: alpha/beta hydrolase [Gammaproteobacteria bacterium]|nr:alpha/beta hydrolase [Gammaproteobacteria bacterium]